MSKFTEEWQATKKSLGHMVGVMESMAAKYGECTELEEVAKKKGFSEGYNLGIKKNKNELCVECKYRELSDRARKYSALIKDYDRLTCNQQRVIEELIYTLLEG